MDRGSSGLNEPHHINLGRKAPDAGNGEACSQALKLANIFNYINFRNGTVLINFKHPEHGTVVSLEARPLPCIDGMLTCQWVSQEKAALVKTFLFDEVRVSDGLRLLSVKPILKRLSAEEIKFSLSGETQEVSCRTIRRHGSSEIQAEMVQNGTLFKGGLRDFSSIALAIDIQPEPPQTFHWIDE